MKTHKMISCPCTWQISMLTLITNILLVTSSSLPTSHRDFLALLSLKSHISDPTGALSSWDAASNNTNNPVPDFCKWTGVSCGDRRHPGHVTAIDLQGYGLGGTISQDIGNLTYLHFIDLSSNNLVGDIPSSLGNCRRLRTINLGASHFSGSVPATLSHLSKLEIFNVSYNTLTGEIPTTLLNVTMLMVLSIERNSFQGQILSWLSNLTSLTELYLAKNNFSGNIPADLCKLTNLNIFDVMNNKLDGHVPPSLFNISSITVIKLGFNQLAGSLPHDIGYKLPKLIVLGTFETSYFEGPIPASLSNASELQYLLLRGNQYHGLIPRDIGIHGRLIIFSVGHNELETTEPRDWDFLTSLANCSNLARLDLEQNNFEGVMPIRIANLSRELSWLTIGRNHIAGTISLWSLGMFQNLAKLTLDDNLFTGTLPLDIGQLSSLQHLDLSHNGFEGKIPQSLANITVLSNLSLSNNFLNNSIPASLGKLTNIASMDVSCNLFRGQIPQEILSIPSLTILLNLSTNALSGAIPTQIGHLNSLTTMDLSMNKLDGEIPEAIAGCVQLRFLYLQGNRLQGQLPKGLNNLVALEKMDLSSNNLTGPIPMFLESIRSLNYLNLSFNNLSGPVPDTGVFGNATALSVTGNSMLCGGPPFLQLHSCPYIPSHKASLHRLRIFIFGAIGLFIFCVCSVTAYCFIKRRITPTFIGSEYLFFKEGHERISYAELYEATGSFSPANLIGSGSSGKVYIGNLTFGKNLATVAIKVLDLGQQGASRSFLAECNALKRIRHRKLVKVITVCSGLDRNGDEFKALVLEYICNGSLDDWLHPDKMTNSMTRRSLSLMKRLNIALDVAEALEYLHDHIDPRIVHCDIKPSNILLDDDLVGHVTDFGLAKIMSSEAGNKNHPGTEGSSFAVKGTIGYVPPEYGSGCDVSTDGDTYSYGILLLEMFTGRRPTDSFIDGVANLVSFVKMAYPNNLLEILDVTATYSRNTDTQDILDILVYPIFRVALACCNDSPRQRMKMHDVVEELNAIKMACAVQMPYS